MQLFSAIFSSLGLIFVQKVLFTAKIAANTGQKLSAKR
jgi:hypothetical protein